MGQVLAFARNPRAALEPTAASVQAESGIASGAQLLALVEMPFPPLNETVANEVVSSSISQAGNVALKALFEGFGITWNPDASGRHVRQCWKVLHRYGATVFSLKHQPQFEAVMLRSFSEREQVYLRALLEDQAAKVAQGAKELGLAELLTKNSGALLSCVR